MGCLLWGTVAYVLQIGRRRSGEGAGRHGPGRGPEGTDCSLYTGKGVITSIHNGDLFVPTGNIYVVSVH